MSRTGAVCFGAVVTLLIGACGASSQSYEQSHSAKQIVGDASQSTGSVPSFHVSLDVTTQQGLANADFDVEGSNLSGKVAYQSTTVRIMHVNGKTFVYGADLAALMAASNAQGADVVKAKASDKWVLMPEEFFASTGLKDATDLQKVSNCLKAAAGLSKKGTSNISGRQVVEIDDQLLSRMFVQTAAPHYFLRISLAGGDNCVTGPGVSQETMNLSQLGQAPHITEPAGYVDLQTLASGG